MTSADRFERMIRWFPPRWREHYGAGMVALLEDTYADGEVPLRAHFSMMRTGLVERVREFGLIGSAASANERLRAGSLAILCGWTLFMIAGADFVKFSERWNGATPRAHLMLPDLGYAIVRDAGIAGVVVVLLGALLAVPSFLRLVRGGNWPLVRGPVVRTVVAGTSVMVFTAGISIWAHLLNSGDRNGGLWAYEGAVLLWCLAVIVTLGIATGAALRVSRQLDLAARTLRLLCGLAITLSVAMSAILIGTALWWASEAAYAPRFMREGIGNGIVITSSTFPLSLVIAGLLMLLGLGVAAAGVARLTPSLRRREATL